nr:hypothetical protein Q903MT_gene687 [Picea sitchensis]
MSPVEVPPSWTFAGRNFAFGSRRRRNVNMMEWTQARGSSYRQRRYGVTRWGRSMLIRRSARSSITIVFGSTTF